VQPLSNATAIHHYCRKGICTRILLKGIYVNLHARPERSVRRTRGREKPKKPPLPFRSFHTSTPELGRWRAVRRFACLLCLRRTSPPSSQPAPSQAIRSPPRLDLPGRAVLGEGWFGGGLELTRGVSSDTCCGSAAPFWQQGFFPSRQEWVGHWAGFFHQQKKQQLGFLLGAHGWSARRRRWPGWASRFWLTFEVPGVDQTGCFLHAGFLALWLPTLLVFLLN